MPSKPFRRIIFRDLVVFVVMILIGIVGLQMSLILIFDSLFPLHSLEYRLAMGGGCTGVVFLGCPIGVLLRCVYEMGKEIERLKASQQHPNDVS